jgi:hypothetical protein
MGRIVHCQGKGGNDGVSEGEWRDAWQRLDEDLEETKLVGCGEMGRDLSVPGLEREGAGIMAEPTREELMAQIEELKKQAGSRKKGSLEFRVGEKGGVSVYGLGRFPVTLYYEQWIRLLDVSAELRAFLEENKSKLKLKTAE